MLNLRELICTDEKKFYCERIHMHDEKDHIKMQIKNRNDKLETVRFN